MSRMLVVGGSGMLAETCVQLADAGNEVCVVARRPAPLAEIEERAPDRIFPLPIDYTDTEAFAASLEDAGPFRVAICWIHGEAEPILDIVADALQEDGQIYHVVGSAAASPDSDPEPPEFRPDIVYRRIVLGWTGPAGSPRWLSDEDITGGVLRALFNLRDETVVGRVRPWEERPGVRQ